MADVAGLVLSAASFAIQLAQVGDSVVRKFQNASKASPSDAALAELSLAILHESEQTKLLCSILSDDGRFGMDVSIFKSINQENQRILLEILERLRGIWSETDEFAEATFHRNERIILPPQATPRQLESGESSDADAVRAKVDVERLRRLLDTATGWNQRLERQVQTFSWLYSLREVSPLQAVDRLRDIAQDTAAQRLGWSQQAHLRQLVLALANPEIDRASLPVPQTLRLGEESISVVGALSDGLIPAVMNRERVFVEFLPSFAVHWGTTEQEMIKRVEDLVSFLHLSKGATFRLPRAQGFYQDRRYGRFGIVFNAGELSNFRQVEIVTLHKAFDEARKSSACSSKSEQVLKRPSLESRFQLAYALSLAVLNFQSVGWVHQGIRSENIAFVVPPAGARSQPPWPSPLLFGYGSSRADTAESLQLFDDNPIRNLYRHPHRWSSQSEQQEQRYQEPLARFNKLHDIYSLGVVLLEIAVWSPVDDLVKPSCKVRGAKPQDVQADLLSLARHKKVAELMGERFSHIIQTCIEGTSAAFGFVAEDDDKENSRLQASFRDKVVDVLKKVVDALKD